MSTKPNVTKQKRCEKGKRRGPDGECHTPAELAAMRQGATTRKKRSSVEVVAEGSPAKVSSSELPLALKPRKSGKASAAKPASRKKKRAMEVTPEVADPDPMVPLAVDLDEPLPIHEPPFPEEEHTAQEEVAIQEALAHTDAPMEVPAEIPAADLPKQMNRFLRDKERIETQEATKQPMDDPLYPSLNDPLFNVKIALRKEFHDSPFDGTIRDIETHANHLCEASFELEPHQLFVRNFLSLATPYQSLLLYHGLGTGKTCSAIGVAEEMRAYMKQVGFTQRILIVASPNVQGNFRQQLFDERRLVQIPHPTQPNEFVWNIESCVGNTLLDEINPTGFHSLPREKVVSNIMTLIHTYYEFMGYGQFANLISETVGADTDRLSEKERREVEIYRVRRVFNHRLVIIDEVHNIRLTEENVNKTAAVLLMKVAKYSENMRLLLLSATPMYNSYKEIIWLTNLMNLNDGRSTVEIGDVFDANGQFKEAGKATAKNPYPESGDDLLRRKLTGYVSYVRGENPYTFPYRIYPSETTFAGDQSLDRIRSHYPHTQMNGKPIETPLRHIRVFLNRMEDDDYQSTVYRQILQHLKQKPTNLQLVSGKTREMPLFENMDAFGYTMLQMPLEALNIVYPSHLDIPLADMEPNVAAQVATELVGKSGLARTMQTVGKTSSSTAQMSWRNMDGCFIPIICRNTAVKSRRSVTPSAPRKALCSSIRSTLTAGSCRWRWHWKKWASRVTDRPTCLRRRLRRPWMLLR